MSKMSYRDHNRTFTGLLRRSLKARVQSLPGDLRPLLPGGLSLSEALAQVSRLEILARTRERCPAGRLILAGIDVNEAHRLQAELGRPPSDSQSGPHLWAPIEIAACAATTAPPTRG